MTGDGVSKCVRDEDLAFRVDRHSAGSHESVERDYEAHRKMLQTLLNNMNSALSNASQDGEQRARQVLSRIDAKVRAARSARKFP